jgi:excisionase family DNA binding protein
MSTIRHMPPPSEDLVKIRTMVRGGMLSEGTYQTILAAVKSAAGAQPDQDAYLTIKQGCSLLQVSKPTFRKLMKSNVLSWKKIGTKAVRVSKLSIERYMDFGTGSEAANG